MSSISFNSGAINLSNFTKLPDSESPFPSASTEFQEPLCLWLTEEHFDAPITLHIQDLASNQKEKNELLEKVTKHWIQDAVYHIFSDPFRSFLELITNALDASSPNPIGKFGLGFLSIFTFLSHQQTKGCTIHIETSYRTKEDIFFSYKMDISKEMDVTFTKLDPQSESGTEVVILPAEGTFSKETLEALKSYLYYLQFYPHGKIVVTTEEGSFEIGMGDKLLAEVSLKRNRLSVKDRGCGISLEIAQTKLYTPSSSSKTPEFKKPSTVFLPELVTFQGKKRSDDSYFIATLNGVVVVLLPFYPKNSQDIHLAMPSSAQPTLARDAVEFADGGAFLKETIAKTVDSLIDGRITSETVVGLYRGLLAWEKQVPSVRKMGFSRYLLDQIALKIEKLLPIPFEESASFFAIAKDCQNKLIPVHKELLKTGFQNFEKTLLNSWKITSELEKKALNRELIQGKALLFIDDALLPKEDGVPKVTSFGMQGVIFAPVTLLDYAVACASKEKVSKEKILASSVAMRHCEEGERLLPSFSLRTAFSGEIEEESEFLFITTSKAATNSVSFRIRKALSSGVTREMLDDSFCEYLANKYSDESVNIFEIYLIDQEIITDLQKIKRSIQKIKGKMGDERAKGIIKQHLINCSESLIKIGDHCAFFKNIEDETLFEQFYALFDAGDKKNSPPQEEKRTAEPSQDDVTIGVDDSLEKSIYQFFLTNKLLSLASPSQLVRIAIERLFANQAISPAVRVFSNHETLWPVLNRPDLIEKLFLHLLPLDEDWMSMLFERWSYSLPPKKTLICTCGLTSLKKETSEQLEIFEPIETFLELSLKKMVLPSVILNELVQDSNISMELKRETQEFTHSLLFHCREALTFTDDEIPFIYGAEPVITLYSRDESTFSLDTIYRLLLTLKETPQLYKKLLSFVLEEHSRFFNKEKILQIIQEKHSFTLPFNILPKTILWTMASEARSLLPYYKLILEQTRSFDEVYFFTKIAMQMDYYRFFEDQKNLCYFSEILNSYLREKISEETLKQVCIELKRDKDKAFAQNINSGIGKPILEFIEKIQRTKTLFITRTAFVEESLKKIFEMTPSFTVRQLLTTLYTTPSLEKVAESDLHLLIEMVRVCSEKKDLQIINQCTEHASEGEGRTAIECLQNSLDAISGTDQTKYPESWDLRNRLLGSSETVENQFATVSFSVEILENDGSSQLILTIKDGVGMPYLKTLLLDFLIPGHSEKEQNKDQIGKLGNGSYQIYKEAEMVLVKTRLLKDPSKVYLLKIFPIRNDKKEVIDLSIKCIDISDEYKETPFFGTEFQVLYVNHGRETHLEASSLRDWIRETVGKTYLKNKKIRLVLKTIDGQEELLQGLNPQGMQIQAKTTPFVFLQAKNPDAEGVVLTSGIFLKPLSAFLKEMNLLPAELADKFSYGWCLNLPLGSYSPVQSRTKVHMEEAHLKELKDFVAQWLCTRTVLNEERGPSKTYYPHFESPAAFDQVYPETKNAPKTKETMLENLNATNLPAFFVNYPVASFENRSFIDWIARGYDQLVAQLEIRKTKFEAELKHLPKTSLERRYEEEIETFRLVCLKDFEQWKERKSNKAKGNILLETYLNEVIFKWFEKKVSNFAKNVPPLAHLKDKHTNLKTPDEILKEKNCSQDIESELKKIAVKPAEIRKLCEEMLTVYCHHYNDGKDVPGVLFYYDPAAQSAGHYKESSHQISLNLHFLKPSDVLQIAVALMSRETPSSDLKGFSLILMTLASAGTLNHELEHARRRNDCGKNFHEDGKDVYGKTTHFEGCAKGATRKALRKGLWDKWCEQESENLQKKGITLEMLKEWISILKKIENDSISLKPFFDLFLS